MRTWDVFLGGRDLEMVEIDRLLATRHDVRVHNAGLSWSEAKASAYANELADALQRKSNVVLVELRDDLPADFPRDRVTLLDHHDDAAGADQPTPLERIFKLLDFPPAAWTKDLELVTANDRGHIAALKRAKATDDQVRDIRQRDRRAQGISDDEERIGREAARCAQSRLNGRLLVVRLPHDRTATVTDALDRTHDGPGPRNVLVLCPQGTHFFGRGRAIRTLQRLYPGGWAGGELPEQGYWGIDRKLDEGPLLEALEPALPPDPASEIKVRAFHHVLLWPLVMRGPSDDAGDSVQAHAEALTRAGWLETWATAGPDGAVDRDYSYEEIIYFHPFVRDFLFGDGRPGPGSRPLRRFRRNDFSAVKIAIAAGAGPSSSFTADLTVERTELFLIRPMVLVLLVELSHGTLGESKPDEDAGTCLTLAQVEHLQSRLRHIYPPFFYDDRDATKGDVPSAVDWIRTSGGDARAGEFSLTSPRTSFDDFVHAGAEPPVFDHWKVFFGDEIAFLTKAGDRDGLFLQQMIDNRIPAMSFIAVDDPAHIDPDDADRLPAFDPPELDYDPGFRAAHRDLFCYHRFRHRGTTYYGNGTAFALVCSAGDAFSTHLLNHFRRHYTHLGLIAQFQHTALLHFADELADIAKELVHQGETSSPAWRVRLRLLQHRFLKFRTRSYFTEMSNQVQGKDLFRHWFDRLGTAELFSRVAETNAQVYQALENQEMKALTHAQAWLANIATVGLVISVVLSTLATVFAWVQAAPSPGAREYFWLSIATGSAAVLVLPLVLLWWKGRKTP